MTMKQKLIEMVNYLGVKTDLMVFEPTGMIVNSTGHRVDKKKVIKYYWDDTVETRAEKIEKWLEANTDGPNINIRKTYIFADMDTVTYIDSTPYLDKDSRRFVVLD